MPLHNKRPHIERALESIAAQTLRPHQVIVVDDASTDGSAEVVRSFTKLPIELLSRDTPGPGGYAARNTGIRAATGDWIAFLDADDEWLPNHLADTMGAHPIEPGIGCYFSARQIEPGGQVWPSERQAQSLAKGRLSAEEIVRAWLLERHCPMWTGAVIVRRELFAKVGLFRETGITRGGDKDMWFRLIAAADAVFSPGPTAIFYQDTVNRVSNSARHTSMPAIIASIAKTPASAKVSSGTLKKLTNQEIFLYARYALGAGTRVPLSFLSWLAGVTKLSVAALLIVMVSQVFVFRGAPSTGTDK